MKRWCANSPCNACWNWKIRWLFRKRSNSRNTRTKKRLRFGSLAMSLTRCSSSSRGGLACVTLCATTGGFYNNHTHSIASHDKHRVVEILQSRTRPKNFANFANRTPSPQSHTPFPSDRSLPKAASRSRARSASLSTQPTRSRFGLHFCLGLGLNFRLCARNRSGCGCGSAAPRRRCRSNGAPGSN